MTELHTALDKILADASAVSAEETVPLARAMGRVLACDVVAAVNVPPWDNSAMDGYAVRSVDAGLRHVSQRIIAGDSGEPLQAQEAARIFTGAPIPPGADAVVIQEDTELSGDTLAFSVNVESGAHIRPAGQDVARGDRVFDRGHCLQAPDLGVLASIGVAQVRVSRAVRVAILSTGNELVEPGQGLAPGQIYNSNRYTLMGLLDTLGCQYQDYGIVGDQLDSTRRSLAAAAKECDLVISTGGVSVGEEDHVKAAVASLGQLDVWKLAIKPGKPLAYGRVQGVPFFGLPGNPAAVFVTFCLVAAPYLRRMQGCGATRGPLAVTAAADFSYPRVGKRQEYLRGVLHQGVDGNCQVQVFDNQSSGVLSLVSKADCLVLVPIGETISPGDRVQVLPVASLLTPR